MRDKRIHVLMDEAELKALDAWRFANHISSRGEAIRRLCECSLEVFAPPGVASNLLRHTESSALRSEAVLVPNLIYPIRGQS